MDWIFYPKLKTFKPHLNHQQFLYGKEKLSNYIINNINQKNTVFNISHPHTTENDRKHDTNPHDNKKLIIYR